MGNKVSASFSCTPEFLALVDARAASLGLSRSNYIAQLIRKDLESGSGDLNIVAEKPPAFPGERQAEGKG